MRYLGIVGLTSLKAPEDVFTPQNSLLSETPRIGSKVPVPLSPYTQSQGVNSSDRILTLSLAPHVVSYGTPGSLLPQSQRRRKSYRHRTISYSFEESERASAAYEDIQGSDDDSNSSRPRPVEQLSLREELRGSSLQSASAGSIIPASPPEFANSQRSASTTSQAAERATGRSHALFPPSQLQLPPPFSAVHRNLSLAASLPSTPGDESETKNPPITAPIFTDRSGQSSPAAEAAPSGGPLETEHSSQAVKLSLKSSAVLYANKLLDSWHSSEFGQSTISTALCLPITFPASVSLRYLQLRVIIHNSQISETRATSYAISDLQ
jgi:hypothetical protein